MKKDLTLFSVLLLLALTLALNGCAKNTNQSKFVPCSALKAIYYDEIKPLYAEIEVLRNNAVLEEVCQ